MYPSENQRDMKIQIYYQYLDVCNELKNMSGGNFLFLDSQGWFSLATESESESES